MTDSQFYFNQIRDKLILKLIPKLVISCSQTKCFLAVLIVDIENKMQENLILDSDVST